MKLMREDFQATGHCNFELGKQCFDTYTAWVLPKKSPYLDSINKGYVYYSLFIVVPDEKPISPNLVCTMIELVS